MTKLKLKPTGILDPCGKYKNPFTKKDWPKYYFKYTENCTKDPFWFDHPTWKDRAEIFRAIHNNQIILVTAGTGVGKTFIVPKLFSHYFNYEKAIIMTVPKKTLVDESAGQVSQFMGVPYELENPETGIKEETGFKYVGIKHSGEKRFDETTKILFSTDGSLAATICKTDPMLENYYGLMIDEAHERNLSIDILLAMCAKICRARPDFKVMIMSATISREMIKDYFVRQGLGKGYGLYNTEAIQIYDKETIFLSKKDVKIADLTKDMMMKIDAFLQNEDGMLDKVFSDDNYAIINGEKKTQYTKYGRDILGFVATESKINTIISYLEKQREAGKYPYRPAFLKLTSKSKQDTKNMAYGENGLELYNTTFNDNCRLKVMISTNVAESSVTFKDKVGFVFDTGTSWQVGYDPIKNGTYSKEAFTAKANISQRKGRTGRNCMGRYYPSYSEKQWNEDIQDYEDAPIVKSDLTDTCLNISLMPDVKNMLGCVDFFNNMLEPISRVKDNLHMAFRNLHDYDMMYKGEITALGRLCSKFGEYSFNIVRMILCGYHLGGILIPILKLAAILQNNVRGYDDFFNLPVGKSFRDMPSDVQKNIEALKSEFVYPGGDHLSMLFLYDNWLKLPEYRRVYLERYYKLNTKLLELIEKNYKELAEIVFNNLDEIKDIQLFVEYENGERVIPGIHNKKGGGSRAYRYDENPLTNAQEMKEYLMNYKESDYGFTFQMFNEPVKTEVEKWGFKPGCLKGHLDRINTLNNIHHSKGGNSMFGGAINKQQGKNKQQQGKNKQQQGKKQYGKKQNKNIKRKLTPKDIEEREKRYKLLDNMKDFLKSNEFSMRGMFAQCPERLIDIGDISSLTVDEKVQIALYFGYCNNVAMKIDIPSSKKYIVKYSTDTATLTDSMLNKVLGKMPMFVLYHTFMISEEYDNTLSIASHLTYPVIERFMKAKKRLLDMKLI